ncbi:MAG TPA: hypothetical protein VFX91_06430 [Alcanivorax sp.]|nr:hypothetical protein [Alcanivorax sp.]
MRLPRDPELPTGLKTLSRLQFVHGFVVIAVATAIWLPSPTVAQPWVALVALLVALYLLLQVGLYAGSELAREGATLVPMAALLLVAACATPFLPAWASTPLMGLAVMLLFVMEKVAAVREHWPEAWLRGRKQHMQFQMVSLGSVVFWLISQDNQALIKAATGG